MSGLLRRPAPLLLRGVEVDGEAVDVLVREGRVEQVGTGLVAGTADVVEVVEGRGGALLPALHDHHLHLLATAAADVSVRCGPPDVVTRDQLRDALRQAAPGPVRGTGYDDSVAGPLSRELLDALAPGRSVRLQHRTGALWALSTVALQEAGLSVPDGLLRRDDPRLAQVPASWPDLPALGERLARWGVLGVTDATPDLAPEALATLVGAGLPQRLLVLGAPDGWVGEGDVRAGPRKVLLHDEADLDLDALVRLVRDSHRRGRPVAVHTVSRSSFVPLLLALQEAGVLPGDRVEHAGVVPSDLRQPFAALGVAVVTQPALAAAHGDDHRRDVDPEDLPDLWPYASLLAAGVRVAPSSDAPYGPLDPWAVLRAACDRATPSGEIASPHERVPVATALAGLLSPLEDPGGPPRRVAVGEPADLVLLHVPLAEALRAPSADVVRLVLSRR
ncbi:MAG: amidohydrolase [Frankiales bacterium]|nr:amidohydrolase [Frankiales bacterium]